MLDEKLAIGESRHEAKQEYAAKMEAAGVKFNVAKSEKIHSIKTAQTYREVINSFANWIRDEKPEVWKTKDLGAITKEVAYQYLKERNDAGLSAWTISRDMAAVNKILKLNLSKAKGGLKQRKKGDIWRSRGSTNANLSRTILNANKDQIMLSKATGIRRESVTNIQPKMFIKDKNGTPVALRVQWEKNGKMQFEKGGRYRVAPILKEYQEEIASILKNKDPEKPMFKTYSKKIDNHAFRSQYATKRYKELCKSKLINKELKNDFRGYDSSLVKEVSRNLGHNRVTIVVDHYLK